MNYAKFLAAKAVFAPFRKDKGAAVNQYGFYYELDLSGHTSYDACFNKLLFEHVTIRLTARNVYRLYINGKIVLHGPARTAHGYCRVDEVDVTGWLIDGVNHIAVEVIEYGNRCDGYNCYSNDSTLEDGLLIAEVEVDGQILAATGLDEWSVCRISARSPISERISHCRECTEIYTLDDSYYQWKLGVGEFSPAVQLEEEPVYLSHEALVSALEEFTFTNLLDYGACYIDYGIKLKLRRYEENSPYYASLPEHPPADCYRSVENRQGTVMAGYEEDGLSLVPDRTEDFYAFWDGGESRVGFIRLKVTCERAGVIDIVHSELLNLDGSIPYYYNIVTRLHVPAGVTEFVTMEPALARYMMVYFRGVGSVKVHSLSILDDGYPDEHRSSYLCSDDNVNRLYNAAKKTLLLNTKDIFMDCPDRERGGWSCDSLWIARAASLMLSDSCVEREFLENYLLTPANGMNHSFFPEVYPAMKNSYKETTGITTWSFWLMCEVCEFIRRTGDIDFREEHKPRIDAFVKGTRDFIGKSGLIENMPGVFVDWSMSNYEEYQCPVSTSANALYSYMLVELGETFGETDWVMEGRRIRSILRSAVTGSGDVAEIKLLPDAFTVDENGSLHSRDRYSEAAMYTALWSGLFTAEEAPLLAKTVRDTMGPDPLYAKDPKVGGSQLFIGLCIRLDLLCRQGNFDKMYEDMLAIYEPQLKEGPGTLWESQATENSSRCHGFTAHAGVHLMRDVLGLGIPAFNKNGDGKRGIIIAPHICGLRWAKGTHETTEGIVSVAWKYDGNSFFLKISLPSALSYRVELPREVHMLDADKVSVVVSEY